MAALQVLLQLNNELSYMTTKKQILLLCVLFLSAYSLFSYFTNADTEINYDSNPEETQIAEDYFAGKTIEWIIPFKEGGGGDTWARFNAPFLTKYIPGNPTIIITNIPGGGSIKGANLFAERVKPDGLTILGTSGSTQMPFLLDDPRVHYDYADYKPIMAYPNGGVVYVSNTLGLKSAKDIKDIQDLPLIYASQGPTSLDIVPNLAFELLEMNVKTIFGFRGRGAGRLAFERGEVKIDYQTSSAYLKNVTPLVKSGEAIPLWSWGVLDDNGKLVRDPSFPELPHFGEVYDYMHKGNKPKGLSYDAWFATMAAGFGGMKLLLVPKETPNRIVEIMQEAFVKIKQDPEYIAKKQKAIGYYEQVIGKKAQVIFDIATSIEEAEKEWCKSFLREKYNLNI